MEGGCFDVEIWARAVGTPFDGYEAVREVSQRGGWLAEGQTGGGRVERAGEVGALALDGSVKVPEEGVVDDSDDGAAGDGEAQRDGDVWEAMQEVGCTVDGVNNECGTVGEGGGVVGLLGFFTDETVETERGEVVSECSL